MTDESPAPEPVLDDDVDPILATIVDIIDKTDGPREEFAFMTLVVQGTTVTGKLCSRKSWVTAMSKQKTPDGANTWPSLIGAALLEKLEEGDETPESEVPIRRRFFHMIDVTVLDGATRFNMATFRGQLSHVGGFTFGTIELSD